MSNQYPLPDSEKVKQTVIKLRQTRREIEEFGLELAEINALLEKQIYHQRVQRIQQSNKNSTEMLKNLPREWRIQ